MRAHNPASMIRKKWSFLRMRLAFYFSELTIQRFPVDAKRVGGLVFVAAGLFENLEDIFFFHFIQRQGPFSRVVEYAPHGVFAMPSLFRFLALIGILCGLLYGGMFALVSLYEPKQREISITVPADKFTKQR